MDIGTAKPTPVALARVPHRLVDVCEVSERMDVGRYIELARAAVDEIVRCGRRVLVVGGSGFYLKSFFSPVINAVDVPEEIRAEVQRKIDSEGLGATVRHLETLNPAGLGMLDRKNPRRVARALERCLAMGKPLVELQRAFTAQAVPFSDFQVELCELTRDPEELEQRIETRVQEILAAGLIDEVRALLMRGLRENPSAARAIGYRETIDFLDGRLNKSALALSIVQNTRRLVKKQRTWFKTQIPSHRQLAACDAYAEDLFR